MSTIEKKEYNLIGTLEDESDALDSVFNEGYSGYVCDAISEIGDNYIPIYTSDIWKNVEDIQEHIEEAIASGLAPVEAGNVDLTRIFQAGYYQYYTQSLYENLDTLAFNAVAEKVNQHLLDGLSEKQVKLIDFTALEEAIEEHTEGFDNNNQMSVIDDFAQDIINRINEGEFSEEE